MTTLRTFLGLIDRHTLGVTGLALLSTQVALTLGLSADMPADIISIAVIFPIVFSINAAYNRRESALQHLASLRSHAFGIYYAHRDWVPSDEGDQHALRGQERLLGCLSAIRQNLQDPPRGRGRSPARVYEEFSRLSRSVELLRAAGTSGSELGRAHQYLRAMVGDFEELRNIAEYRTPVPLRAYSHVFLNTFPVLFGPHFAALSRDHYLFLGYAVATLYSLVLVSLDNIQEKLENPFDSDGVDDVRLIELDTLEGLLGPEPAPTTIPSAAEVAAPLAGDVAIP